MEHVIALLHSVGQVALKRLSPGVLTALGSPGEAKEAVAMGFQTGYGNTYIAPLILD